ncbi:MAG: ATP-binding protein [Myxococcota bacterium]|nr:ATP-binding protein [Myxococcota bacterium]
MPGSVDVLRRKAILLLRREREVFELRQERRRTEVWLNVFQALSSNLSRAGESSLLEQWVTAMVDELAFQVAAVHAYDAATGKLVLRTGLAPRELATEVAAPPGLFERLEETPCGFFARHGSHPNHPLGEALGLGMFHWLLLAGPGSSLLLTSGFVAGTEEFRAVEEQDSPHFLQLGRHLGALLDNARLFAELDRERLELSASNRELRETQEKLVQSSQLLAEVSRRAGMADVATGVLHNVGNALNSINVSVELLAEKLSSFELSGVRRAGALLGGRGQDLQRFLAEDERGRKLGPYLEGLGGHLAAEREGMCNEVQSLRRHVEHMKAIVGKQQSHATTFDVAQSCAVSELVDDALTLSEHSLNQLAIRIERDYADVPRVVTDRHKVLQILVNLLSNARQALSGIASHQRTLRLGVEPLGDGRIAIAVRDSGVGIAAENRERLFRFGYTTRPDGHGFGLHTSAIAARELGGRLTAHSDGPGTGATFVLELPLELSPSGVTRSSAART